MSDTLLILVYIFGAIGALFVGYWATKGLDYIFLRPRRRISLVTKRMNDHAEMIEWRRVEIKQLDERLDLAMKKFNEVLQSTQTKGPKHVSR